MVVTPTTPQDWETRNTGVTLEVEPVVGGDNTTIDLNLVPQVVEFEGFINYGSPINAIGVNTIGGAITTSVPIQLTPNVINQPVFSTRKVTTSVSVYDGQTVVLGGLMREDVQKTEDKVPIIGDIPLLGRAFPHQHGTAHQKEPGHLRHRENRHARRFAVERGRRGRPAPAGAAGSSRLQKISGNS